MKGYKAESEVSVTAVDQAHIEDYGAFGLITTVSAADAASIAYSSGNNQTMAISATLVDPLVAVVKDTYGNVKSGTTVTFGVSSTPDGSTGASVSPETDETNAGGLAET